MKQVMVLLLAVVFSAGAVGAGEPVAAGDFSGTAATRSTGAFPALRLDRIAGTHEPEAPWRSFPATDYNSEKSLSQLNRVGRGSRPVFAAVGFAGDDLSGLRRSILRFTSETTNGASELETGERKRTYSRWILPVAVIIGVGLTTYTLYSVRSR